MAKGDIGDISETYFPVYQGKTFPVDGEIRRLYAREGEFDVRILKADKPFWYDSKTVLVPIKFEVVEVHRLSNDLKAKKMGIKVLK